MGISPNRCQGCGVEGKRETLLAARAEKRVYVSSREEAATGRVDQVDGQMAKGNTGHG